MLLVLIRSATELLPKSTHNICFHGEVRKIPRFFHGRKYPVELYFMSLSTVFQLYRDEGSLIMKPVCNE